MKRDLILLSFLSGIASTLCLCGILGANRAQAQVPPVSQINVTLIPAANGVRVQGTIRGVPLDGQPWILTNGHFGNLQLTPTDAGWRVTFSQLGH